MNKLLTFIVCICLSGSTFAQFRQLNNSTDGAGRIMVGSHTNESLRRIQVDLRGNGEFEIKLYSSNMFRIEGRWRISGDNRVALTIETALGDNNAGGTGTIWLQNMNAIREVSINGRSMNDNLVVTFTGKGGSGGGGSDWSNVELSRTVDGTGTYNMTSGRNDELFRAQVTLRRDGFASVTIWGDRSYTLSGHQSSTNDRMIDLAIDRIDSNYNVEGRGFVALDGRGSFSRVEITGKDGSRRFSLQFSARSGGGGGGNNWIDSFHDRATGSGEVSNGRQRDTFGQIDLNCKRDGKFDLALYSDRVERLSGVWRANSRNQITLTIERAFNKSATGSGTVRLSGSNDIVSLSFSGNGGNGRFSGDFNAGESNDFNGLNVSGRGRGWLRLSGEKDERIDSLRVWLKPSGDAEISFSTSGGRYSLSGEWSGYDNRRKTVSIEMIRGFGASITTSIGSISLNNEANRPERLNLSGRFQGRSFSINFDFN